MIRQLTSMLLIFCGLLLVGCAEPSPAAAPISTPTSTPTVEPTLEPTPTVTEVPCSEQLQDLPELVREWDDADQLAGQTARIALSQPVSQLQSIRRKLDIISLPECADAVRTTLGAHMDAEVAAYLAFMGQESDSEVSNMMQESAALYALAQEALIKVMKNEPVAVFPIELRAGGVFWFGVTYTLAPSMASGPHYDVSAPWTRSGLALSNHTVSLAIENKKAEGEAFCEIWVDGEKVEQKRSSEPYGQIICRYTLPQGQ